MGEKTKNAISPMWKEHQNQNPLSNNNDAPSVTKYGSLVQSDAQIVAVYARCPKCAPDMEEPNLYRFRA